MKTSEDFKPYKKTDSFTTKEFDILERNKKFFQSNIKYINKMIKIISGESIISIRILDYFITNYSKKCDTYYKIKKNGKDEYFYVNIQYKNQLNGYSKKYFDPFCRDKKIYYTYCNKNSKDKNITTIVSSIGQLNFFQWAISNKIIKYVKQNLNTIENDMKTIARENKERNKKNINSDIELVDEESDIAYPDPLICSSDIVNNIIISPCKKNLTNDKSSSDKKKKKRQPLSKSIYSNGIRTSRTPIKIDFD